MKSRSTVLTVITILLFAISAIAADKVVVIPMNTSSSSPAIAGWAGGDQYETLTTTWTLYRTVTLELPGKGLVIVNASGHFQRIGTADSTGVCAISQGTLSDNDHWLIAGPMNVANAIDNLPFGTTRALPLDAGPQTFNLICKKLSETGTIALRNSHLNAVFHSIPNITIP